MLGVSSAFESADNQCSWTAKINTATVATRNSGTATIDRVSRFSTRSSREPRYMADKMPIDNAIGTDTAAATPARSSDLGNRRAMSSLTGTLLDSDWPGSPDTRPNNQYR